MGAWPALVSVGVAVGVTMQLLLAAQAGLSVAAVLVVSLVANLAGLLGAKLYCAGLHSEPLGKIAVTGMGIQGYVIGAIATLLAGAAVANIAIGQLLDVTAPGLLVAMDGYRVSSAAAVPVVSPPHDGVSGLRTAASARVGSRPSYWSPRSLSLPGVRRWSRSRHILRLGSCSSARSPATRCVAQLLLPFRDLPRKTTRGRTVVMLATALVLAGDIGVGIVG